MFTDNEYLGGFDGAKESDNRPSKQSFNPSAFSDGMYRLTIQIVAV